MNIKIKRLFNGLASIRDYQLKKAKETKDNIVLNCCGKIMTTTPDKFFQISSRKFKSKFGGEYQMFDIKFKPDEEQ